MKTDFDDDVDEMIHKRSLLCNSTIHRNIYYPILPTSKAFFATCTELEEREGLKLCSWILLKINPPGNFFKCKS